MRLPVDGVAQVRRNVTSHRAFGDFHTNDKDAILNSDHLILKYLSDKRGDIDRASCSMVKKCQGRLHHGVNDVEAHHVAREIIECGQIGAGIDQDGRLCYILKTKYHRRHTGVKELVITFVTHLLERHLATRGPNVTIDFYLDVTNAGLTSGDLDLTMSLVNLYVSCYPNILRKVYICGMNFIMKHIITVTINLIPSKYHSDRIEFLDAVPNVAPSKDAFENSDHCSSVGKLCIDNYSQDEVNQLVKYYDKIKAEIH
ncbi:Motile sperm domain-containing protein 2 [Halotydeus destructor]|nr:Motile sperm domain-containing protein 2 [Halotydeus destructor]